MYTEGEMTAAPGIGRTVDDLERDLGSQIRALRLRANRTQAEVARSANLSISAVQSLEHGGGSSVATLAAVVRALGRADWLTSLVAPEPISPMAMLRQRRSEPQRVRASSSRRQRPEPRSSGSGSQ
jgi:transcriptional regulator with XRE-family HTH domain